MLQLTQKGGWPMNLFRIFRHCQLGSGAFISPDGLPTGSIRSKELPDIDFTWATTYDFKGRARNHCGTICAVNLALWLLRQYKPHPELLFRIFYQYIKNGPTLSTIGLRQGFKHMGFPLKRQNLKNYEQLKTAIAEGQPVCILLSTQGFHWHWVMAIGWLEYSNGQRYLRIVDNWHPSPERYYKLPKDAEWIHASAFRFKEA